MRRRLLLVAAATGLVAAPPAQADHWPVAGGSPSRSAYAPEADDTPIAATWSAPDGVVRTPVLVSGGGQQRVAYGTTKGYVHLRMLEGGAPVGPGEGTPLDNGSLPSDVLGFGDGSVGFADTSTEERLGQMLIVHNDDRGGAAAIYVARLRLDNGELIPDEPVHSTAGCSINSSPLLTPPAAGGSRLLYFTMDCAIYSYLVRVPVQGDATAPTGDVGAVGFANVPAITPTASPTLVVMRRADGTPGYHVVVPRRGGLTVFDAAEPLEATAGNTTTPAAITAEMLDPTEIPQTAAAAVTARGAVAGGEGSGTGPAPALYVAAAPAAGGDTRVYKFVQEAAARTLTAVGVSPAVPATGAPAPAMGLTETVTAEGTVPGHLLVTSASNLTLLRTADLSVAAQASGTPLPSGQGFSRTSPVMSGTLAFVVRDGDGDSPAEHLVLRLDGLTPLQPPAFTPAPDPVAGAVAGQPAASNGHVVFGTARGPFAYASAAARPSPRETIRELPPRACEKQMDGSARADRLTGTRDGDRILGGRGNDRLSGGGGPDCLFGQEGDDLLGGGSGDDLLEGGAGNDRLSGGPGRNQLKGGADRDTLRGGDEGDRLDGGGGPDRVIGGAGGDRVLARDKARDRIDCGKGRDTVVADRKDRVGRSCERVKRR